MKVWVKFNAGFQLCPPYFNFAPPPPRSRKAGDAPDYSKKFTGTRVYNVPVNFFELLLTEVAVCSKPPCKDNHRKTPYLRMQQRGQGAGI